MIQREAAITVGPENILGSCRPALVLHMDQFDDGRDAISNETWTSAADGMYDLAI